MTDNYSNSYIDILDTYPLVPPTLERFCDDGNLAVGCIHTNKSTLLLSDNPVEVIDALRIIIRRSSGVDDKGPEDFLVYRHCTVSVMQGMIRPDDDLIINFAPNLDIRINPTRFQYFVRVIARWDEHSVGNLRYVNNSEFSQMFISKSIRDRLFALNLNQFAAGAQASLYNRDVALAKLVQQGYMGRRKQDDNL